MKHTPITRALASAGSGIMDGAASLGRGIMDVNNTFNNTRQEFASKWLDQVPGWWKHTKAGAGMVGDAASAVGDVASATGRTALSGTTALGQSLLDMFKPAPEKGLGEKAMAWIKANPKKSMAMGVGAAGLGAYALTPAAEEEEKKKKRRRV